jgi:hypothetical protein
LGVLLAPLIWNFIVLVGMLVTPRPPDWPICPHCRYNLRGLRTPVCPECSTPTRAARKVHPRIDAL